jgi:SAM-dependent methyltransferase
MKSQDFEAYADHKKFNNFIASTWDKAFAVAINYSDKTADRVRLLDYGCGDGKYFKYWLEKGLLSENIHGLEISEKRIQRCRQIGWENALRLKPGGVLLISTPNYPVKRFYDFCDAVLHQKWARLKDDPTHITFFNHKRLTQILGQQFKQIEAWPFKQGFLYKRFQHPSMLHKLFFLCRP